MGGSPVRAIARIVRPTPPPAPVMASPTTAEVTEKVKDFVDYDRNKEEPHTPEKDGEEEAEDKSDEKDTDGEVDMLDPEFDEGEAVELEAPAEVKFTNDLDPAEKK